MRCSLVLGLILFVWAFSTLGTDLVVFYEQGCPQCGRVDEFLERVSPNYPALNILRYEIHGSDAQDLLDRVALYLDEQLIAQGGAVEPEDHTLALRDKVHDPVLPV